MRLKCERPKESKESYENDAQQKPQPVEKEAEVVADRGEHGVDGVADAVSEVIVVNHTRADPRLSTRSIPRRIVQCLGICIESASHS